VKLVPLAEWADGGTKNVANLKDVAL